MKITKVMGRREFITGAVSAFALAMLAQTKKADAVEALDPEILKSQLRVKTDAEAAFVDDVVDKAKKGVIPMKIFMTAYRYALDKGKSKRVIYFRYCLVSLTQKAGLKIDFKSF